MAFYEYRGMHPTEIPWGEDSQTRGSKIAFSSRLIHSIHQLWWQIHATNYNTRSDPRSERKIKLGDKLTQLPKRITEYPSATLEYGLGDTGDIMMTIKFPSINRSFSYNPLNTTEIKREQLEELEDAEVEARALLKGI